jgi:tetratricopeptide (TPR) repeat protein
MSRSKVITLIATFVVLGAGIVVGYRLTDEGSPEQPARAYYERGEKLAQQHDYAKAAVELRNAVRLKREMLPAWRSLAQIEESSKQWNGLTESLRAVIDLDPGDTESRLKLAKLLLLDGSASDALKLIDAVDIGHDQNAKLLALKAVALLKLNNRDGAVEQAQRALDIEPSNADALMALATVQAANGDARAALQILDGRQAPIADIGIGLLKLKLLEELGERGEEESLLQALIKFHPEQALFRKQLIQLYIDEHRQGDAERTARAVAAANPADSDAELDVVRVLYETSGPEAAKQELLARISGGGQVFQYQTALADLESAQGNFVESKRLIQTLVEGSTSSQQAVTAQVKLAEVCLKAKEFDEADTLLSKVLGNDPRNAAALKLRSSLNMARGKFDLAIVDLRNLLNEQPRSPSPMMLLAEAYEKNGSIELARQQYANAVRASDFDRNTGLIYASFLVRQGNIGYAESFLSELQAHWPRNLTVLSALGQVKLRLQDWSGAQEIADSMRKAGDPRDLADLLLGDALGGQRKREASIAAFQRAADAAPSEARPMISLVSALVGAGETEKAIAYLDSKLQANPDNVEARVLMGSVQIGAGAPDQAITSFNAAITSQPKNVVGYEALANLYSDEKKFEDAIEVLETGLQARPDSMSLRLMLGGALERNKQFEAAITQYEQSLKETPDSVVGINNLANLLSDHRQDEASFRRAESLAERLEKIQEPQYKDTVGWVHYRLGDYRGAISRLESAAAESSNISAIHYHLGMSYLAADQKVKGLEELKLALTMTSEGEFGKEIQEAIKRVTD